MRGIILHNNFIATLIRTLAVTALFLIIELPANGQPAAAPPDYISYQGQIKGANGAPIDPGAYDMELSLYDAPTDGQRVWGPFIFDGALTTGHAAKAYVMNDGRFTVLLGPTDTASRPIRDGIAVDGVGKRYVQVRIGDLQSAQPVLPRQQLLSGTYAFQAFQTAGVGPLINYGNANFGIGIDAPTARLDVNGDTIVHGTFTATDISLSSVTLESASFSGDLNAPSTSVQGDATITGTVYGNFALNATQFGETHNLFSGLGSNSARFAIAGATSTNWYCTLSGYEVSGLNSCEVKFVDGTGWVLDMSRTNSNNYVRCRVNCIKLN